MARVLQAVAVVLAGLQVALAVQAFGGDDTRVGWLAVWNVALLACLVAYLEWRRRRPPSRLIDWTAFAVLVCAGAAHLAVFIATR